MAIEAVLDIRLVKLQRILIRFPAKLSSFIPDQSNVNSINVMNSEIWFHFTWTSMIILIL